MRPRWQRTARRDVHTVDVTAFLSLMVILVPFLLVTAVFSRTAILEIQPAIGAGDQVSAPDPLQLQVIVRQAVIKVSYLDESGQLQTTQIDRSTGDQALESLDADREFLLAGDVFNNDLIDGYIALKMEEVTRLRMSTHPIELDMYYSL